MDSNNKCGDNSDGWTLHLATFDLMEDVITTNSLCKFYERNVHSISSISRQGSEDRLKVEFRLSLETPAETCWFDTLFCILTFHTKKPNETR